MTQRFLDDGSAVGVTVVEAGPCHVTAVKSKERDGYEAVQVGYSVRKKLSKAEVGHLKKNPKYGLLHEFPYKENTQEGDLLTVEQFAVGDILQATGISKGKGFQGVVKRHGFSGSLATHGHKDQHRMPGSIGSTGPARVFKDLRMSGRMGGDQITTKGLTVIEVIPEENVLLIKGAIPGPTGSYMYLFSESTSEGTKRKEEVTESAEGGLVLDQEAKQEKSEEKPVEKKEESK